MSKQNYYAFLGIPMDANENTIRNAIERIRTNDSVERHESRLVTIEHTLTDPTRRRVYDRLIKNAPPKPSVASDNEDKSKQSDNPSISVSLFNKEEDPYAERVLELSQNDAPEGQERHLTEPLANKHSHHQPADFTQHLPPQPAYHKDRLSAAWLAFFSFGFGVHRFWLGQRKLALLYLFINASTAGLFSISGVIEGIVLYFSSEKNWDRMHADKRSPYPGKDKIAAALLAFIAGSVGAHRYYLGQWRLGILYTLFSWTLIPWLIAIAEGVSFLKQSDAQWNKRYGQLKNRPSGCFTVLFIPVILSLIGLAIFVAFISLIADK